MPRSRAGWAATWTAGTLLACLFAGCIPDVHWAHPDLGGPRDSPTPFLALAGAVALALIAHAAATYGARRAALLVATVAVMAMLKERANPEDEYIVLLPHRLPASIAAGWLVTVLLGHDFARRVQRGLWPGHAPRAIPHLLLMGGFAWHLSNAIEPIGQVAGWWDWTEAVRGERYPYVGTAAPWVLMTTIFGGTAIAAASSGWRRLLLLPTTAVALGLSFLFMGLNDALPGALPSLALLLIALGTRVPGLRLDPELAPELPAPGRSDLVDRVPALALAIVCGTLAAYAMRVDAPGWERCLLPVLMLGALARLAPLAPVIETALSARLRPRRAPGRDARERVRG